MLRRVNARWPGSGFSSHVAEAIPFENKKAIEDLACYLVRAPLSLQKLRYRHLVGGLALNLGPVDVFEQAFALLADALAERSPGLLFLKVDRAWDRIRDDPRFARLVGRVGIP